MNTKQYTFREITDISDLEAVFRLRYEVYMGTRAQPFLNENPYCLDLDVYDLHARHYALFFEEKPVAYVRLVLSKTTYYNPTVFEIGKQYGFYQDTDHQLAALLKTDYPEFPFLSYSGVPEPVKTFYQSTAKGNYPVLEPSRLIVAKEHRSVSVASTLIQSALAAMMSIFDNRLGYVIIDCSVSHTKFYASYGFSVVPDVTSYSIFGIQSHLSLALFLPLSSSLSSSSVPQRFQPILESLRAEY